MDTQRIIVICPKSILCVVVKEHHRNFASPKAFTPQDIRIPIKVLSQASIELVGLTGVEPVTLRLSSACSNQLSYRPTIVSQIGGAEESRTPDL